jgi:hypothetical protein
MFRYCIAATILSACVGSAQATTDLSGTWGFTHADDRFQGWVVLHQSGPTFRGTWHTSRGKSEPDDDITGRVDGNTVTLWRFIGDNRQSFVLTLSADGNHLDGFGDGFFLNHTNLNMLRSRASAASPTGSAATVRPAASAATVPKDRRDAAAPAPTDLSGLWGFTCANDRFQGTVTLRKDGSYFTGTWHTSKGKTEPDDAVSARVDGNTVTLWRFIGDQQQHFVLTLSTDGSRLDGYGDGFFLNHTNLNMLRAAEPAASTTAARP